MAAAVVPSARSSAPLPAPFPLSPDQAERLTGGRWMGPRHAVELRGAVVDSRQVRPQCLFVCCVGGRVDGHDYAVQAALAGAGLILAARPLPELAQIPVLVVADVVQALGALATAFRTASRTTHWIGVTGSSGKTTVKELISSATASQGPTHATAGNLNNHLGVPLSVLAVPAGTQYAIIEMGANHQHEISALCAIVQPTLGVITCLGPAHLEGFGGIEGVARAKSELFAALPPGATAILGISGLDMIAARLGTTPGRMLAPVREAAAGRRLLLVGSPECPVDGEVDDAGITLRTPLGSARLPLLGGHNLANAAIAYQAARAVGVEAGTALLGLEQVQPVAGRLCLRTVGSHRILDDTYNANPGSMIAGLQVLAATNGRHLAVLGAMGELGMDFERGHQLVGLEAARLGLPVIVVGAKAQALAAAYIQANGPWCRHVPDSSQAAVVALEELSRGPCTVLVKASRSSALDTVVTDLIRALGSEASC